MEILIKKFKEHSHIPIDEIKKAQHKHAKDLIQPRIDSELNPDYLRVWGTKNLNISDRDARKIAEKYPRSLIKIIDEKRRKQ